MSDSNLWRMNLGRKTRILFFLSACPLLIQAAPLQRVANTTLQMPAYPPTMGYTATNAFGNLTFTDPVAIVSAPGETNRLFVVEQAGRIAVITNFANPTRTVFLDISSKILGGVPTDERGLLGLAFHPGYETNGYFFVYYVGNTTTAEPNGTNSMHDILARYQVSSSNPNQADAASEVKLIAQYDEAANHNAGCLQFGPDGYLYLSLGDEGGGNDQYNNSQRIDKDFFSGIIRIDVDESPGSLIPNSHPSSLGHYTIPSDNPFVGATSFNGTSVNPANVRTEFWAVGLRNPWRYSFDPQTGFLYCADVGQNAYEEVDIITPGGNYGWAYREGLHPGPKTAPGGFTSIDPIQEYAHGSATNQGFSITGGVVYRGSRISQLFGAYLFADYVSGNVWILRYDGTNTVPFQRIFAETGISAFGVDPSNGDVLMADQNLDTIRRIVYSSSESGTPLPPTLDATGAFANLTTLATAPGIVPYDVNVPLWSDNAIKSRWFSVPNTNLTITFNRESNWMFPTGTVWIKHFELELTNGIPSSRQRLETRLLIKNATGIYGVTYRWGNSKTNATLVPDEGMDEAFLINDGGTLRTQIWHYPSRQECVTCHTPVAGYSLGVNTPQLNRDFNYNGTITNQIAALSQAGYFNTNVTGIHTLRALAHMTNTSVSLEYRVRSYLAANCVQCHQPNGSAQSLWDARITTPTSAAGIINGPLVDDQGDPNNRVVVPGSVANSVLLNRVSTRGGLQMPPLASMLVDTQAVTIITDWVTDSLPGYQTFADWQVANFGSTGAPNSDFTDDPDGDGAVNYLEYLTGTDPLSSADFWRINIQRAGNTVKISYPQIANCGFEVQCSSNPKNTNAWIPLDAPGNEPIFSVDDLPASITDPITNGTNRFYRVRVFAP
jgi:uncharacterized repeat protein (TIGR03806 family)